MTAEYRYKAFISYSHQDEAWGRWLQRSLESYRVPKRLVGSEGRFGPVAARIAPVFRDREDLSSAADLTVSVKEELAASETLVVICSPAAASSRWVNEEILYFRELGRGDRILALTVDGDPQAKDPEKQCFPPALRQGSDGTPFEPLAADARKSADGKALARLKLVAGILGIRLDDLRQRDLQRRHRRWMISASGAIAVAVLTTVLAIVAITARYQAENRRQHAENLVDYMVDDLKRKLDAVGRLDILEGVGEEVSKYLETLDPREETEESLLQKAKVWRQLGEVSMSQGKLDEAMAAFAASREVTRELLRRKPGDPERVYEMAQSEYWVGYVHLEKGEFEEAEQAFNQYVEYADRLAETDPGDPEWVMEQSYAHGNIATLLIRQDSEDVEQILREVETAAELNRQALEIEPDSQRYQSEYGNALAWLAETQLLVCDLGGALQSRQETVRIARETLQNDPGNANLQRRYAYSLTGLATVAIQVGLIDYAIEQLAEAANILGRLYANDPSNLDLQWDALIREFYIASLKAETAGHEQATARLSDVRESLKRVLEAEGEENRRWRKEWVDFQLGYAAIAWHNGEDDLGAELWKSAVERIGAWAQTDQELQSWQDEIVRAKFLMWHRANKASASGSELRQFLEANGLLSVRLDRPSRHISCGARSRLVLQALLDGDTEEARTHANYLLDKGYFEPSFARVCTHYDLCQGAG